MAQVAQTSELQLRGMQAGPTIKATLMVQEEPLNAFGLFERPVKS